jgi:hypothetical protein
LIGLKIAGDVHVTQLAVLAKNILQRVRSAQEGRTSGGGAHSERGSPHSSNWGGIQRQSHGIGIGGIGIGIGSKNSIGNLSVNWLLLPPA